jgi:hypothetical protein
MLRRWYYNAPPHLLPTRSMSVAQISLPARLKLSSRQEIYGE